MTEKLKSTFMGGLKVITPLVITILLIYWIYIALEKVFRAVLLLFLDKSFYFNGLGFISAVVFTVVLGMLIKVPLISNMIEKLKKQFLRLPGIKTVYGVSSNLMALFTNKGMSKGKIVKLKTPVGDLVGILTQDQLPDGVGKEDEVAVFVSMSYQIGGFTFIVPKDSVEPIDLSAKDGIALTMSAYTSR